MTKDEGIALRQGSEIYIADFREEPYTIIRQQVRRHDEDDVNDGSLGWFSRHSGNWNVSKHVFLVVKVDYDERIRACLAKFTPPVIDWRKIKAGDFVDTYRYGLKKIISVEPNGYDGELPVRCLGGWLRERDIKEHIPQ